MRNTWRRDDGTRWNNPLHDRMARRFRHHVRTPSNPKGRIHREKCHFHSDMDGQAHHVDYAKPFLVCWLCFDCHRKADHGSLVVTKAMLWDYSSLVQTRPGLYAENRAGDGVVVSINSARGQDEMAKTGTDGIPF